MTKGDFIQFKRGEALSWTTKNPVLGASEPGVEEDTGRYKLGDGVTHWNDLDYYMPASEIHQAIQDAIEDLPSDGGVDLTALTAHINAAEPHPAYDNGSSLALLYQNAKV